MPRLVVEKGRQKGKFLQVDKTSSIIVGRSNAANLQLDDPMASRKHFSVEFKRGDFYVIDLGSANGTFLNGETVEEYVLEIGDMVQRGEVLLSFLADQSTLKHDTVTGQNIAGYLIEERVGRGAMGTVYKAVQLSLDRTVALKILARELVNDSNFIDMFVREARNAGQLNHPNIVQVYDVGRHQNIYYISMEFMAGSSVYELINREGAQPFERAMQIAIDSTRGLRYAEKKAIVHRDIKPDNLMLGADGATKIGDLGIARRLTSGSAVLEEGIFGSPHYMAPEQAQRLDVDSRTDIYSLGATLFHVLTGQTPFKGKSPQDIIVQQISRQAPKLAEVNPMISPELALIVDKCMEKDPDERYQNSQELLDELENLQRKTGTVRALPALKKRAKELKNKYLLPAVVIAIAAVAAAVGFFVFRHFQHTGIEYKARMQQAQKAYDEAQADVDANKPGPALEKIEEIKKNYSDLASIMARAEKLAQQARKLKEALVGQEHEEQARKALDQARTFEKSNPDKLEEAVQKFGKVAEDFTGTKAAQEAKNYQKRLSQALEDRRVHEISARAQAAILGRARNFKRERRYGKALKELAVFPESYAGTEAAKDIKDEKNAIIREVRNAFGRVKTDAERLISAGRYEDARNFVLKAVNRYEVAEISVSGSEILKRIDSLEKKLEVQEEKAILAEDRKKFEETVVRARKLIFEHRFNSAVSEYNLLLPFLKSKKYRSSTQVKIDGIEFVKEAKKTLVDQINQKTLRTPIRTNMKKNPATAIRATSDKLIAQYDNAKAEGERYWKSFTAAEMVSFLDACKFDARGHLAAGIYARELGNSSAARRYFNKALQMDSTLRDEVKKFSGD